MKKLLTVFSAISISSIALTNVISCDSGDIHGLVTYKNEVYVDKNELVGKDDYASVLILIGNDFYINKDLDFELDTRYYDEDGTTTATSSIFKIYDVKKNTEFNSIYTAKITLSNDESVDITKKYLLSLSPHYDGTSAFGFGSIDMVYKNN
ncbi:hypothetical protein [Spiroplasma turonicum]|uniref:Lipoprotein n=1 Tax=Spiroplasma turonicum TaxID=216946 RepID=A0A0K1P671_9MOLU|nr:hypothetical protein [Spiroplasma turonicum]AKU79679.1 hypothetical protein STURON_00433 [Spiroplasma turonicum]ALX70699.1 hypothetical protein STURO_v1c04310 [Spiroplasma turonicum]